jgi:hypothetical protein
LTTKYFEDIELSLIGRNLWIIHKNVPYADPEENLSSGNVQGYQSGSYPTTRTIGLNVKLKYKLNVMKKIFILIIPFILLCLGCTKDITSFKETKRAATVPQGALFTNAVKISLMVWLLQV